MLSNSDFLSDFHFFSKIELSFIVRVKTELFTCSCNFASITLFLLFSCCNFYFKFRSTNRTKWNYKSYMAKLQNLKTQTLLKNTVISPHFLVWTLCGKAQFQHSFGRFTRNYVETVPFHKISSPEDLMKLQYFTQWEPYIDYHKIPNFIIQ